MFSKLARGARVSLKPARRSRSTILRPATVSRGAGERKCLVFGFLDLGHFPAKRGSRCSVGRRKCSVGRRRCSVGRRKCSVGRRKCPVGRRRCSVGRRRCSVGRRRCSVGRRSETGAELARDARKIRSEIVLRKLSRGEMACVELLSLGFEPYLALCSWFLGTCAKRWVRAGAGRT
jgi:hypothetical protein